MSVADLVGEAVEGEALRGVLGARGVRYAAMGPHSAGTGLNFLRDSAAGGGAAGRTVFARGGPEALVEALAAAAQGHGATIRCDADVAAIRTGREAVEGVALASGDEIDARIVASSADPKQTFLSLIDPAVVGPTLGWRAEHIRAPGVVAKVTLVLESLPAIGGAADERLHGRIVLAPTLDDLERAFNDSKYGRISEHPYLEATIPTLSDPSLAPAGTHVLTALFQYAPRRLRDAQWDEAARDQVGDAAVRTLEAYAPGLAQRIVARRVVTPEDLEREYGLSGAHPMHGEHALDQFFAWRPLLGHARYRLAGIRGLYLCGAGAHPGGGVTGGPGRNAARAILADARRAKRRSLGRGGVGPCDGVDRIVACRLSRSWHDPPESRCLPRRWPCGCSAEDRLVPRRSPRSARPACGSTPVAAPTSDRAAPVRPLGDSAQPTCVRSGRSPPPRQRLPSASTPQ